MAKMHLFTALIAFFGIIYTTLALNTNNNNNNNNEVKFNNGRYTPYTSDPYYNNRDYYTNRFRDNREYYPNRQLYERRFRNYNPDVVAPQARIVDQEMKTPDEDGAYSFSYDTDNGIHADEHGVSVKIGNDEQKEVVEGSYSFVTPEGVQVLVRYTADENGFHPTITYGGVEGSLYARRTQPAGVIVTKPN